MATKKENAALIAEKLGIQIDPEASEPKAPALQAWADNLEQDAEGVRYSVTAWQLQRALDVDLVDQDAFTTEQLTAWLARLPDEREAVLAELEKLEEGKNDDPPPPVQGPEQQPGSTATGTTSEASSTQPSDSEGETPPLTPPVSTFTVRVNDAIAAFGGTFSDPEQEKHKVIGAEPVSVTQTFRVLAALRAGTLVRGE